LRSVSKARRDLQPIHLQGVHPIQKNGVTLCDRWAMAEGRSALIYKDSAGMVRLESTQCAFPGHAVGIVAPQGETPTAGREQHHCDAPT
jgi:hypothetical protein